ncbi:hypothetical protein ASPBRDRAFT_75079, partial [Aspergillus brasiliensis CBS 101740]
QKEKNREPKSFSLQTSRHFSSPLFFFLFSLFLFFYPRPIVVDHDVISFLLCGLQLPSPLLLPPPIARLSADDPISPSSIPFPFRVGIFGCAVLERVPLNCGNTTLDITLATPPKSLTPF